MDDTQRQLPPGLQKINREFSHEFRYDKLFCSLIDQGMDPGDASTEARRRLLQSITWDFGPSRPPYFDDEDA